MTGLFATKPSTNATEGKSLLDLASTAALKYSVAFWVLFGVFLVVMDLEVRQHAVLYIILFSLLGFFFGVAMIPLVYLYYKMRK